MDAAVTALGNIFICGRSALRIYRSRMEQTHISQLLRRRATGQGMGILPHPTAPTVKACKAIAAMYCIPLPLDTLVVHPSDRRKHSGTVTSLDTDPVHATSFLELEPSIYLASPELVYYQLARTEDVARAWMLAMELTGCYALETTGDGMHERAPLTTPTALRALFDTSAAPCRKACARSILRFLIPGARSPREAHLAALARLPRRWGGWGIPGIELNRPIELAPAARVVANRSYLEVDLYIEPLGLALEYDSDGFHLTREAHERDARKINALKMMGIRLMSVTNGQLVSWEAFSALMDGLERDGAFHRRPVTPGIRGKQRNLWNRLLDGSCTMR